MSLAIDNNVSIRILNKFTCILYFSMAIGCNKVIINRTSGSLFPHITFYTCVCDLSVMVDFELTFSYHMNLVAQKCYYQLRQLWVVSHSLTHQSTLTLVYAFVTSRIDCCSSLLVVLALGTLARLDRVLRSAAHLVGRLPNFSSTTAYMHDELHWLPISQRIQYRITAMVSRCVLRCTPLTFVTVHRRVLRSAAKGELLVPRAHFTTVQRRAVLVVCPSAWNNLPVELRSLLMVLPSRFFFGHDLAGSASE